MIQYDKLAPEGVVVVDDPPEGRGTFGWVVTFVLIAGAAFLLGWGMTGERIMVVDREGAVRALTGPEMVRAATSDRLLRGPTGELVDLRTPSSGAPGVFQPAEEDCFT